MNSVKENYKLVWDDWNRGHIRKHNVLVREVNEAFKSKETIKQSYLGRLVVVGKTKKNRLLTVVLSFEKQKDAYVVSVRDSSKKERKIYNGKNKTN